MSTSYDYKQFGEESPHYDKSRAQGFTQVDVVRTTHGQQAVVASFYGPMAKINAMKFRTRICYAEE